VAHRLLRRFGGLAGIAAASLREVAAEPGVGIVRAAALAAAFGLSRRLGEATFRPGSLVRSGGDVARLVRDSTRGSRRESFHVVLLDARHRLLGMHLVSLGAVDSTPVHPREVFSPAIRDTATAVVVAHNHPSGDPTPSPEDRAVTDRLRAAGELVGIELVDHLVVGVERYYSFAEESFFVVPAA
jgi:DNA repair protein RadC